MRYCLLFSYGLSSRSIVFLWILSVIDETFLSDMNVEWVCVMVDFLDLVISINDSVRNI
jgi:hypothetical protein